MEREIESRPGSDHEVPAPDGATSRRRRRPFVAAGVIVGVLLGVAVWQVPIRLPSTTTLEVKPSPDWSGPTFVSDCHGGSMAVNNGMMNYQPRPPSGNSPSTIPGAGGHGWLRIDHDWRD